MTLSHPHITVACVIEHDDRFLLVEEIDKTTGQVVFNQPAGHVDENESLFEAALRETREETAWTVQLKAVLSVALYQAPSNGHHYLRTTFLARALKFDTEATLDPDITRTHWLDYESILSISGKLRSPLVLASIEQHRRGEHYPLDLIYHA
jgi:ADP-ribose pyrophosphatase YjhB (NUDIX family)